MLEQIWKEYGSYDYLQEDLQQIRTQRGRNLYYPEKMFTGFRMILEEATNQKWQLTQKIDELQLKKIIYLTKYQRFTDLIIIVNYS